MEVKFDSRRFKLRGDFAAIGSQVLHQNNSTLWRSKLDFLTMLCNMVVAKINNAYL